jgi:hypothetical protein
MQDLQYLRLQLVAVYSSEVEMEPLVDSCRWWQALVLQVLVGM